MRNFCFTCIVFILITVWNDSVVHAAGSSPFDAAPVGKTVSGIIECGDNYEGNEAYDVNITLTGFVRGKKEIRKILSDTTPAAAGNEYVLAKIKFEYIARGRPGDCVHTVKVTHFTPLAISGVIYKIAPLTLPGSEFEGPVSSGEVREGWAAFQVAADDAKPLMTFSVDDSGAVQHGGKLWFQLY